MDAFKAHHFCLVSSVQGKVEVRKTKKSENLISCYNNLKSSAFHLEIASGPVRISNVLNHALEPFFEESNPSSINFCYWVACGNPVLK